MADKLDVFLSSAQKEFEKKRRALAKQISKIPFLNCKPLEQRGANPQSVEEASIRGVRECDIYVGIYGTMFSKLTKKEYNEAVRKFKPCFVYVQKIEKRDRKLTKLIEKKIKPNFKFHEFRSMKDLCKMVLANLEQYVFELLKSGLEQYRSSKRQAIKAAKAGRQQISKAVAQKQEDVPENMIRNAKIAFKQGDYLSAIVSTSTAIEVALRLALSRRGLTETELRRPLVMMLEYAMKMELLRPHDRNLLTELRYIRNATIHEGRIPSRNEVRWAIEIASRIAQQLSKIA